MVKSMTGFGQASLDGGTFSISVEVRSLNSKFLDLNLRLPKLFSDKELDIRNLVNDKLERGKVSVTIDYQKQGNLEPQVSYNEELFRSYYLELKKLADRVVAPHEGLFEIALNSPDVIQNKFEESLNEEEWSKVRDAVLKAMQACDAFRTQEGAILLQKFKEYVQSITLCLQKVKELDPRRVQKIRDRLKGNIVSFFGEEGFDQNRLEQEIIFYIEKLDIQEEVVRLSTHLDYFNQVLNDKQSNGKKLGFIAQEIGREINTIGSKSNDADMQKQVVVMKEELEKIKEQLNNIL
jgi:uncharacterized protein (TIGR00255 family)